MKTWFVIEADSAEREVWVYEVEKKYTATIEYHRDPCASAVILSTELSPKFYGQLDALLVNKTKLEKAEPITPEQESA